MLRCLSCSGKGLASLPIRDYGPQVALALAPPARKQRRVLTECNARKLMHTMKTSQGSYSTWLTHFKGD
jgi:hypothetical protein